MPQGAVFNHTKLSLLLNIHNHGQENIYFFDRIYGHIRTSTTEHLALPFDLKHHESSKHPPAGASTQHYAQAQAGQHNYLLSKGNFWQTQFEIQKENINLAKRIINCGSEHRRDRYVKEWKDIMRFLKVRSKFKPTLDCQSPKICRFEAIPGRGSLLL